MFCKIWFFIGYWFFMKLRSQNLQVNLPADLSTGYYRHLLCVAYTLRPARKHTHFGGCQRKEAFKRQYPGKFDLSLWTTHNKYSRTSIRFYVVNKITHYQLGTPFFSALHDEHGGSVSDPVGICSPFFSLCHCRHQLATRLLHVLRSANGSGKTQLSLNRCRNNGIKLQIRQHQNIFLVNTANVETICVKNC